MTKVLVLSYNYPPCVYGFCIRVLNFVRFLPQFGFQPVILSVEPEYYKDYSIENSTPHSGIPSGIEVVRTASLEPKTKIGPGLASDSIARQSRLAKIRHNILSPLQRLGDKLLIPDIQILWAPFAINAGKKLLAPPDIKLIFAVGPPFSVLVIGYLLKRFTGKKLVLDFKDMWVGRDHHEHKSSLCRLLSKPLEKAIVKAADRVILNTDYSYRCFVDRYPEYKAKFLMLPNGYDPQIDDIVKDSPAEPEEQRGLFKIVHTGTMDTDRNPEGFIYVVKKLMDEHPEFAARLKVYFSGKVHHTYVNLIKELGLDDIFVFKGYLSYQDNIRLLNSASLLLLITTFDAPDAITGKLYEYLALKKPILAITEDGASKDLLLSLNVGKVVHPQDRAGIKHALWTLYQDFCQGKLIEPAIPLERFNRRNQTQELAQTFSRLVD
jgi:glycosyltransferase involved in cell wall biosynthesis